MAATRDAFRHTRRTPLLQCAHAASTEQTVLLARALLAAGARVDACRANSHTRALHVAASFGLAQLTRELCAHNADIEASDERGLTPLALAAMHDRLDIVDMLIVEFGADVSQPLIARWPFTSALHLLYVSAARRVARPERRCAQAETSDEQRFRQLIVHTLATRPPSLARLQSLDEYIEHIEFIDKTKSDKRVRRAQWTRALLRSCSRHSLSSLCRRALRRHYGHERLYALVESVPAPVLEYVMLLGARRA